MAEVRGMPDPDKRRERVMALVDKVRKTNEKEGAPLEKSLIAWGGLKWGVSNKCVQGYLEQLYGAGVFIRDLDIKTGEPMVWHRDLAPKALKKVVEKKLEEFMSDVVEES